MDTIRSKDELHKLYRLVKSQIIEIQTDVIKQVSIYIHTNQYIERKYGMYWSDTKKTYKDKVHFQGIIKYDDFDIV